MKAEYVSIIQNQPLQKSVLADPKQTLFVSKTKQTKILRTRLHRPIYLGISLTF